MFKNKSLEKKQVLEIVDVATSKIMKSKWFEQQVCPSSCDPTASHYGTHVEVVVITVSWAEYYLYG